MNSLEVLLTVVIISLISPTQQRSLTQYSPPWNESMTGKEFPVTSDMFSDIRSLMEEFHTFERYSMREFVVATAITADHYNESLDAIASAQTHLKDRQIYVYDLGLNEDQVKELQRMCRVEVRIFNFSRYPPHVSDIMKKSWKPIIILDVLRTAPGVFWMDSSVRIQSNEFSKVFKQLNETMGVLLFTTTGHSNFATTHKQMYEYLTTDIERMKKTEQREVGAMLFFKTKEVAIDILWWWYHCAMVEKCIAPINEFRCDILKAKDKFTKYFDCHRFEQSALNIILANQFNFDDKKYFSRVDMIQIHRYVTSQYKISYCDRTEL